MDYDPRIRTDIPLPNEVKRGRKGSVTTLLRSLIDAPIGASAFFANAKGPTIYQAAHKLGGAGWCTMRKTTEENTPGFRVWKKAEPKVSPPQQDEGKA